MMALPKDQEEVYQEGKTMWNIPANVQGMQPQSSFKFAGTNFVEEFLSLLTIKK
jgi:hypothetical protein